MPHGNSHNRNLNYNKGSILTYLFNSSNIFVVQRKMIGFRALMLLILCKRVSTESCQSNFTDRSMPDDIQAFFQGKGTFTNFKKHHLI